MVVKRYDVIGYENFKEFIQNFNSDGNPTILLFSGSHLEDGKSWCDDCQNAHPLIEDALSKFVQQNINFVEVQVGDKPYWKNLNCPFRKDPQTRLMVLPTLIKWKAPQRLEGEQCEKIDLLELFFTDD